MLKKYETEVKKDTKKSSLMPTQVAQQQRKTQNVETAKKTTTTVSTNKAQAAPQGFYWVSYFNIIYYNLWFCANWM